MVFKFLSNLWLTNDKNELVNIQNESNRKVHGFVKVDITTPHRRNMEITTHAFLHMKKIIVFYNDVHTLIEYLKDFVVVHGGGHSYINELESIIKMNLGVN